MAPTLMADFCLDQLWLEGPPSSSVTISCSMPDGKAMTFRTSPCSAPPERMSELMTWRNFTYELRGYASCLDTGPCHPATRNTSYVDGVGTVFDEIGSPDLSRFLLKSAVERPKNLGWPSRPVITAWFRR